MERRKSLLGWRSWPVLAAVLLTGCSGDSDTPTGTVAPPSVPTSVTLSPAAAELTALGGTVQLTAEVRDRNGQAMTGATVVWSSSDASVATVAQSGLVTAVANGTATITAAAGGVSGTAAMTVAQAPDSVAVSPTETIIAALGDTVRLAAEAFDANGHGVVGAEFSWESSAASVATVDAAGLVTAVANGTATITAGAGGVSGMAAVTVAQSPDSVAVSPAEAVIAALGDTLRLAAEAFDANGRAVADAQFSWSSSDTLVAAVDGSGLVTAVGNGSATITAGVGSASGSAVVRVLVLDLTGLLQRFIDAHGIGAAALGVMKQGTTTYDAVGHMDPQRRVPARQDIMMRLASITKPITAAAIHKLASAGMLALDDRVFDLGQTGGGLLRIDPFPQLGDSRLADITVLHLLQHRGGWDREVAPDFAFREIEIAAALSVASPPGRENTVRFVLGQPLQFNPGSRRAYSNVGYLVLGLVIEEVSGADYMTYVLEEVLDPLGVARDDVIQGRTFPEHRSAREPWYDGMFRCRNVFDPSGARVWCPEGGWDHEAKIAHGGLVASPRAILAFLDAYVVFGDNIGRRRTGGEGLGWWAYHTGSLDGANTLAFQSGNGVSYVVFFNRRLSSGPSYVELFMDVLEDQLADVVAARYAVAEALAGKADSDSTDVLVSRGITVGAARGSR